MFTSPRKGTTFLGIEFLEEKLRKRPLSLTSPVEQTAPVVKGPSYQDGGDVEDSPVWQVLSEKISHVSSILSSNKTEQPMGGGRRLAWVEEGHRLRHAGRHHSRRQSCYTGNEVLLVIGVTCLLNFAFVLAVMACVHYCSNPAKPDLSPRLESVVVDSETDSDENRRFHWDPGTSVVSLHNISSFYRHKTPSHSMEQLLFVD